MKQNERFLVFAVTGFLALILVVAIVFGDNPTAPQRSSETGGTSLSDILNGPSESPEGAAAGSDEADASRSATGLGGPAVTKIEQPLRVPPPSAESLVMQKIGPYTVDSNFRIVNVRANDNWARLAVRWCGDTSYVEEIQCLNESTLTLKAGQKLLVPLVPDEALLEKLAAEEVPTLLAGDPRPARVPGAPAPTSESRPDFSQPVVIRRMDAATTGSATTGAAELTGNVAPAPPGGAAQAAGFVIYTVQPGDMLEPILKGRFGDKHYRARQAWQALNPGLDANRLRVGQTFKLPTRVE